MGRIHVGTDFKDQLVGYIYRVVFVDRLQYIVTPLMKLRNMVPHWVPMVSEDGHSEQEESIREICCSVLSRVDQTGDGGVQYIVTPGAL